MKSVEIQQVANGYIVRPSNDFYGKSVSSSSELHVFETFDALVAHLKVVFIPEGDRTNEIRRAQVRFDGLLLSP